jgi:pimeloyl-ACP methyl ester carboxylesterase
LADRSKDILDKLRQCGVGKRPVIFVGHSMGGLVAKKMLVQAQAEQDHDLVKNTKGVMFFSTPHMGTKVAKMNSTTKFLFFPTTEVCDLEPDSPQLLDLNQNFVHLVEGHNDMKIVSFGEAFTTPMMGIDVTFVPPSSADIGLGEFHQIKANHINVCKPDSKESLIYKKFFHLVSDVLEDNGVPTSYSH